MARESRVWTFKNIFFLSKNFKSGALRKSLWAALRGTIFMFSTVRFVSNDDFFGSCYFYWIIQMYKDNKQEAMHNKKPQYFWSLILQRSVILLKNARSHHTERKHRTSSKYFQILSSILLCVPIVHEIMKVHEIFICL